MNVEYEAFWQAIQENDAGLVGVDPSGQDPEFYWPPDVIHVPEKEVGRRFLRLVKDVDIEGVHDGNSD